MHRLSDIDWFEWNGTKCTEYGVHVLRQPAPVRPIERISEETIRGRSETPAQGEGAYLRRNHNAIHPARA